ncbi:MULTISPECIES: DNA gyrase inhibitor YacG [Alphaproteobacteria]|uniref:DNA gyrase inhibitor YacG n=1 Tax=Alphaproteobacteria TaxID=28211 RepID=UPI0012BD38C0|nr:MULTISPECIES: DNA gyrase inhibitor YacG [Alphaproteobacteria]MTH99327.1 DNA gyrase inhibitor YacG [Roseibium sp. RKSG952]
MSCPICGEDTVTKFRPFCSKRCADIDLAKWLNGSYAVPSQREEDVESEESLGEQSLQRPH